MNINLISLLYVLTLVSAKRSFTIVLDTTVSMEDEVIIMKNNIASVLNVISTDPSTAFEDYVLVPFNYPDVQPVIISTNPQGLINSLHSLPITGGSDFCPEIVLTGLKKALEMSKTGSFIYVFTDAYASDDYKINEIRSLCQRTDSKVTIFLSGNCPPTRNHTITGSLEVYYEIAKECSGSFFRLDATSIRQAYKYMREMVKEDWNEAFTHDLFSGQKKFRFSVDAFTKDVIFTVCGDRPSINITDKYEEQPRLENLIDSGHSLAFRLMDHDKCDYNVQITSYGTTSVTLYKRREFPYKYGFSTKTPHSLDETASLPMPGWTNYVLIKTPEKRLRPVTVEFRFTAEQKKLSAEVLNEAEGLYIAKTFFKPDETFQMMVISKDEYSEQEVEAIIQTLHPQKSVPVPTWTKPSIKVIGSSTKVIEFGKSGHLICKVDAYPSPKIVWADRTGRTLPSDEDVLLEMPSTYLSYLTLKNITTNETIYCNAQNSLGTEAASVELSVHRPYTFQIVQYPQNTSIEYGTEGRLYCEVQAYPEAEYTWYQNGTSLSSFSNFNVVQDGYALVIKNATLNDGGIYECGIKNGVQNQKLSAKVDISGLEIPELDVSSTEIVTKPDQKLEIKCTLSKGTPKSEISWRYKSKDGYDFTDIPTEASVYDGTLTIYSVDKKHGGVYRCETENIVGSDAKEVTVKIQYAPIIINADVETITVKEGEPVELKCQVDAEPEAEVRWEMTQDDVIVTLDDRHIIDDDFILRFNSSNHDSGNYHCIAENDLGRSEKTTKVNVLVEPYIESPPLQAVTVAPGTNLTLPCNVIVGNPVPSILWEFIAPGAQPIAVLRKSSSSPLNLQKVSKANEGTYKCTATNIASSDNIRIHVKVL